jgi:hypothetical protein
MNLKICKNFRLFKVLTLTIVSIAFCSSLFAQSIPMRKPANTPDEDMIIVPVQNVEISFVDKINDKNKKDITSAKQKVERWILNEEYGINHGLQNSGAYITTTPEQRRGFFERNYLRFYSKEVERGTNQTLQESWNEWNTDDEIDAINSNNEDEGYVVKASRSNSTIGRMAKEKKENDKKEKDKKIHFGVQPRIEIGSMRLTMDSYWFNSSAWIAANGQHEVNVERGFKKTKTKMMMNYYVFDQRILAAVDQKLNKNWSIRLSHEKLNAGEIVPGTDQDNRLQFRFYLGF